MGAFERIKRFSFIVATFGVLRNWPFGGLVASACAIPALLLFRSLYWVSTTLFYWLAALSVAACVGIIQLAIIDRPDRVNKIILDKFLGVVIALLGVPLVKWRVIIFGFILFHVIDLLKPFAWYNKIIVYIERLPGAFGVLGAEVLAGVFVNGFLHLMAWVMG